MTKSYSSPGRPSPRRRRSPGEGSVYRLADGRWRGAVGFTEAGGRRRRVTVNARSQAEARRLLDEVRRELRLGANGRPDARESVADYLSGWLDRDQRRVRPSTHQGRELHVRRYLIPALGRVPLSRLTVGQVEAMTAGLIAQGRSPMTARHARATLRAALADAVREGRLLRNAAADARPPSIVHRPIAYLTAPQVRQMLEATREDELGPLYALAVSTGLRQGELLGLSWPDIDFTARTLTVRRALAVAPGGRGHRLAEPKTARSRRTVALSATALDALRRQARSQGLDPEGDLGEGLVFARADGGPLSPDAVTHGWRRANAAAGIPRVRFHDLRHSTATLMLAERVPLAVISSILGHSGIAITHSHYAAIVPELEREAADALDRALGGPSPTSGPGSRTAPLLTRTTPRPTELGRRAEIARNPHLPAVRVGPMNERTRGAIAKLWLSLFLAVIASPVAGGDACTAQPTQATPPGMQRPLKVDCPKPAAERPAKPAAAERPAKPAVEREAKPAAAERPAKSTVERPIKPTRTLGS